MGAVDCGPYAERVGGEQEGHPRRGWCPQVKVPERG
jgi:hypothetical protein